MSSGYHPLFRPFNRDCKADPIFHPDDGTMVTSGFDAEGRELPDPLPLEVPDVMKAGPSLHDTITRMLREQHQALVAAAGYETEEEANDFDCGEDAPDPSTPYEEGFTTEVMELARKIAKRMSDAPAQPSGNLSKQGSGGTPENAPSTPSPAAPATSTVPT